MIARYKDAFAGTLVLSLLYYFVPSIFSPLLALVIIFGSLLFLIIAHFELQKRLWAVFFIALTVLIAAIVFFGFSPTITLPSISY